MINRKIPWTSQPQYPVEIDQSSPLGSKCIGYFLPNGPGTIVNGPTLAPSIYGLGRTFVRASSQHITIPLVRSISPTGKGATLVGIFNSTNIANGQATFAITDGTNYFAVLLRGDSAGDPISAASWHNATSAFRQYTSAAYTSGTNYVCAITTDASGNFSVYLNGILQSGSYSNSGALTSATLTKMEVGNDTGSATDYLDGSVFGALAFEGVLSAAEIKSLSGNLWQIFKAPARRLWAGAAGGGATATIAGVSGSGQVGALSLSGNASVSPSGTSGTGSVGSVVASVSVDTAITGVSGTGGAGTTTQSGAANVTVSSAVGTGLVGTVSAVGTSQNGNAVITGVSGSGQMGILSATAGSLRTNQGGGWETYVAPIRKKTVKEVKKEFELLSYAEVVAEQKTAGIKIQHTKAKIEEIKPIGLVATFSLAPEIAKLKLIIAEEKIKIEALRELETKILIHAAIKKKKEMLMADLAFIAEYLMDEDEYDDD